MESRHSAQVVPGSRGPFDDEVQQDDAAMTQENIPAEPLYEIQGNADDRRGEQPCRRKDSIAGSQIGEDDLERDVEKCLEEKDVDEWRGDIADDDQVMEPGAFEEGFRSSRHDYFLQDSDLLHVIAPDVQSSDG